MNKVQKKEKLVKRIRNQNGGFIYSFLKKYPTESKKRKKEEKRE